MKAVGGRKKTETGLGSARTLPTVQSSEPQRVKRWSAVSDGGEDQGAEEVTVYGAEEGEESSRQFWKRARLPCERLFLLSALRSLPPLVLSYLGETRGLFLHSPACSGPFGHTRPFYDSRPQTWNGEALGACERIRLGSVSVGRTLSSGIAQGGASLTLISVADWACIALTTLPLVPTIALACAPATSMRVVCTPALAAASVASWASSCSWICMNAARVGESVEFSTSLACTISWRQSTHTPAHRH